ncbi:hypothetical protein ATANTOWER_030855 [Ataeniobius toweri]|uniref:Secreted protein n=1 Tax=Ataeniobius toweri TaxID=208326 RepID=A0ABU7BDA1_9TELE|nr:hypothetical protein [Ataeniobius toweri]
MQHHFTRISCSTADLVFCFLLLLFNFLCEVCFHVDSSRVTCTSMCITSVSACLYKNLPLLFYTGSAEVKEEAHLIYPGLNSPQDSKYILTRRGRRTVAMETHSPGSCGGEDELL